MEEIYDRLAILNGERDTLKMQVVSNLSRRVFTPEQLATIQNRLAEVERRRVIVHSLIRKFQDVQMEMGVM